MLQPGFESTRFVYAVISGLIVTPNWIIILQKCFLAIVFVLYELIVLIKNKFFKTFEALNYSGIFEKSESRKELDG